MNGTTRGTTARLSGRVRWAILLALVLSGLVGMVSANEALMMADPSAFRESTELDSTASSDAKMRHIIIEAELSTLEGMREVRVFILGALAMSAGLAFIASMRLLWPLGFPRAGMRKLLAGSAVAVAILRTLDGAQLTVAAERAGKALGEKMATDTPIPGVSSALQSQIITSLGFGAAALHTLLMVSAFLGLAAYFGSQTVQNTVAALDGPVP